MIARTALVSTTLLLLVECGQTSAQKDGTSAQPAADQKTGRIEGRVLGFPNVEHLPKARVQSIELYQSDSPRKFATAEPDGDGKFVFEGVPSGRVRLNPILQVGTDETTVTLPEALLLPTIVRTGETTELALFGKGRPIVGKVVLPANVKLENGRVGLQLLAPPFRAVADRDGRISHGPGWRVYSVLTARRLESDLDAEGRFRIEGVREGKYRVTVHIVGEGKPLDLSFDGVTEKGYPNVEHGNLTVPFMAGGESDKPHNLGTLTFAHPPKGQ